MIVIKHALHPGINGADTYVVEQWNTGPRNLVKALEALPEYKKRHDDAYGNIGSGGHWIEVDGYRLHEDDLFWLDPDNIRLQRAEWERESTYRPKPDAPTVAARKMIEEIREGAGK